MKKSIYLALAAVTMALFACNSKPAESEQQAEESQTIEAVEQEAEEPAVLDEAEEPLEADSLAAESADSIAAEEAPAAEETAAEQPAAEQADDDDPVFTVVEHMAVAPCSNAEIAKLLTVNLNEVDPEASECRVIVSFIVEKDARTTHHEVKRSNCDNEKLEAYAIKHIQEKLPRFKEPARQSGHPVRTSFLLPVSFKKL